VGVSQTAAFNRGRHLYSTGRPSGWALAHISSFLITQLRNKACTPVILGCTLSARYVRTCAVAAGHARQILRAPIRYLNDYCRCRVFIADDENLKGGGGGGGAERAVQWLECARRPAVSLICQAI